MVKFTQVKFQCDHCNKTTEFVPDKNSRDGDGQHPYLYEQGWVFIYNMEFKKYKLSIKIFNKHFCCNQCFFEYLKIQFEEFKKHMLKKI